MAEIKRRHGLAPAPPLSRAGEPEHKSTEPIRLWTDDGLTGSYSESECPLGHSGLLSPGLSGGFNRWMQHQVEV